MHSLHNDNQSCQYVKNTLHLKSGQIELIHLRNSIAIVEFRAQYKALGQVLKASK